MGLFQEQVEWLGVGFSDLPGRSMWKKEEGNSMT